MAGQCRLGQFNYMLLCSYCFANGRAVMEDLLSGCLETLCFYSLKSSPSPSGEARQAATSSPKS